MSQLKHIGLIFVCLAIFGCLIGCASPLPVEQAQPETKTIDAYIMQLGDVDVLERREAAKALEATGQSISTAVVALIEVLDDADSLVRNASSYALLEIGASAVPDLIPALSHKRMQVRLSVIAVLGKIGGDITNGPFHHLHQKRVHFALSENVIVPALIPLLQDKSPSIRSSVASALSQIGPAAKGAVPIVTTALTNKNKTVRASAAYALGKIGPPAEPAIKALNKLLWMDAAVRRNAAKALGQIGPAAIPMLIKGLGAPEAAVRQLAARALGQIGPEAQEAVSPLINALSDDTPEVRRTAVDALGRIGPPASTAVPQLTEILLHDLSSKCRLYAAESLRQICAPTDGQMTERIPPESLPQGCESTAVAALIMALADESEEVRRTAVYAIGQIGNSSVVPALIMALLDKNEEVRQRVAFALGEIGDSSAVPALIIVLADTSEIVRSTTVFALHRICVPTEGQITKPISSPDTPQVNEATISELISALYHEKPTIRIGAVHVLKLVGSEVSVPALLKVFKEPSSHLATRNGSQETESPDAGGGLITALQHPYTSVRVIASWALSEIGDKSAVPALIATLDNPRNYGSHRSCLAALKKIGTPQAMKAAQTFEQKYFYKY